MKALAPTLLRPTRPGLTGFTTDSVAGLVVQAPKRVDEGRMS